jgi:hypothetical protein
LRGDLHAIATAAAGSSVSPEALLESIVPVPAAGLDPLTGAPCTTFSAASLRDDYGGLDASGGPDGLNETTADQQVGSTYCFELRARPNISVTPLPSAQVFRLTIQARGSLRGVTFALGSAREVYFVVPPAPP